MNALLGALCNEHRLERHVQIIDQKLDVRAPRLEQLFDVPLQNQLLECKLQRAQIEVRLYSQAIARGAVFRAAKHPNSEGLSYLLMIFFAHSPPQLPLKDYRRMTTVLIK
jgi:hypothetical protein